MSEETPERVPAEMLDIHWIEKGVCADEFENRRLLRENGMRWHLVPPGDDGMPSGLIEVHDPAREHEKAHARFADMLVDPSDPWGEYHDPREMPMDAAGVPYWIHRKAQKWREWDEKERRPGSKRGREPEMPVRCKSIKADGTRCWAWSADGNEDNRCRAHAPGFAIANNAGHNIAMAKLRIIQGMPDMADLLADLAYNAASEPVRLKAITEMMDRGGVNAQTDVNVSGAVDIGADPSAEIRARLGTLAERLAAAEAKKLELERAAQPTDIVDADIVSEHPEGETA